MTAPHHRTPQLERELGATAAMAIYSLAVAIGFARVFSGWAFLADLVVLIVVGHGLSFALRRLRTPGWVAIPITTVVLLWLLMVLHYRPTFSWLVPTDATWAQLDLEIGVVRDQFRTAVAPVIYGAGWAVLAGLALVVTIVMADAFAFRAEARGEALVPGGVLFVFIAALSSSRLRLTSTVLLIAAGVLLVVALRGLHDRSRRVELTATRGPASLAAPAAVATALAIAVAAGIVGPRVPGADADPLYNTRGRGGVTEVISPLVDIRSRLTNRSNIELFRVNADSRAYWRSTTLAEFDGSQFRQPTTALEEIGAVGEARPGDRVVRQHIQIVALGGQLVPAAAAPFEASGRSLGERLEMSVARDTGALLSPQVLRAGDEFTIVSASPVPSADQLRAATAADPPDPVFLDLPDDLPDIVAETGRAVAAGAATPYDQALALQAYFREFEYSLEVQAGHGSNVIESFLQQRVGYCEQFSATFAAMARTLGLPTRVAVGFTPGLLAGDGFYSVRGRNAHAWPEVWFDGIGWVAFEPTPSRGAPGAEEYTGVPEQQDESPPDVLGPGDFDEALPPAPTTPSTLVPATTTPGASEPTIPQAELDDLAAGVPDPATPAAPTDDSPEFPWRFALVVLVLLALLAVPAVVRGWRRRAARHHGPAERVELAWSRARTAAERAGVRGRASMTTREWADATANELPVAGRPMRELALVVERVEYAPPDTIDLGRPGVHGATLGDDCDAWALQVARVAGDTLTAPQRVRHYFTSWN